MFDIITSLILIASAVTMTIFDPPEDSPKVVVIVPIIFITSAILLLSSLAAQLYTS